MGLTLAKCPACGADLNLETDRDYFYCPNCGSKVLQHADRIVIEHVNRTIDEAEIKKIELDEKKYNNWKRESEKAGKSLRKFGIALDILAAVLLIYGIIDASFRAPIITLSVMLLFGGLIFTFA